MVGVADERAVDDDGDGKIDRLEIDIEVWIDEAGNYQLMAVLQDLAEEMIAEDYVLFDVQEVPSGYTATLRFDAAALVAHGVDGPWTLTAIELFDDDQVLLIDTLDDYVTAPYGLDNFAWPPPPDLAQVLPDYGPIPGGNEIVLQGDHLEPVTAISFGGQGAPEFEVLSDSSIRAVVPQSPNSEPGAVNIELTTPWHLVLVPSAYTYVQVPGDFDNDGDVDLDDMATFIDVLLGIDTTPAHIAIADMNGSGTPDGEDIQLFVNVLLTP